MIVAMRRSFPRVSLLSVLLFAAGGCSSGDAADAASSSTTEGAGAGGVGGTSSNGGAGTGGIGTGGANAGGANAGGANVGGGNAGGGGGAGGGTSGPGLLGQASYDAAMVFPNHSLLYTPTGIAWDGTSFWVGGDGNLGGFTEVRYDGAGNYLASYEPGVGFSAIYTKGDGTSPVFGRQLTWNNVMKQNTPGQWSEPSTLAGGNPPVMMGVAWDDVHGEYIGLQDGTLHRWNAAGQALANVTFQGFGSVVGEDAYPSGRRVAFAYGHYLTYVDTVISAWDADGNRVASSVLNGAGTTDFDSALSFSFAQGKVWVVDSAQGTWRGYVIAP